MKIKLSLLTLIALIFILTTAIFADPCDCRPGDANGDGDKNVGDAFYLTLNVFKHGPGPTPFELCSGDANNDGFLNIGDAVYLINHIFKHGPRPATCEEWVANWGDYQ